MLMEYLKLLKKDKILCKLLYETRTMRISIESSAQRSCNSGEQNSYYVALYNDIKMQYFFTNTYDTIA